jgi:hypothetical protein
MTNDDDAELTYLYFGGARQTQESTWCYGSDLFTVIYCVSDSDIFIKSIKKIETYGAIFPALKSAAAVSLHAHNKIHVWGGLNTASLTPSNDIISLVKHNDKFNVTLIQADCPESISVTKQQGDVPSARFGHSLTLFTDDLAILHGGLSMPFRESASLVSPFRHVCEDGKFYLLNNQTYTWTILNLPEVQSRTFHTASYSKEMNCIFIVGGLCYMGFEPSTRLPFDDALIIKVFGYNQFSLEKITFSLCENLSKYYLSYHSSCIVDEKMFVVGGFSQMEPEVKDKPALNPYLLIYDLQMKHVKNVEIGSSNLTSGCSCVSLANDSIMIVGGSVQNYFVYTSKAMQPSPCDLQAACIIGDSPEISPISWVQCEGKCKRWLHQYCVGVLESGLPRGKYICSECKQIGRKRKANK